MRLVHVWFHARHQILVIAIPRLRQLLLLIFLFPPASFILGSLAWRMNLLSAVFGALGTLSALQVPRRRAWLTLGAGVALLGFLGTGARSDLLAHLLGFAAGVTEGLAVRRMTPPPRSLRQPAIALVAVVPILLAWWRALAR